MSSRDTINSRRDDLDLNLTPVNRPKEPPEVLRANVSIGSGWAPMPTTLKVAVDGTAMMINATEKLLREFGFVRLRPRPKFMKKDQP